MVSHEQRYISFFGRIALAALFATAGFGADATRKFYPDDPLLQEPPPVPVKEVNKRDVDLLYDFIANSFVTPKRERQAQRQGPCKAANVNTLDEVPHSAWYTNRHFYKRMSIDELKRGPGNTTPPVPNGIWQVVSAKSDGVTPGFVIEDEHKNRYVLKLDPPAYPELASAPDVIGSKFFYALGYNVPENYIVHFRREQLAISEGVHFHDAQGKKRPLTGRVLDDLLKTQPKAPNGTYRAMASRWIAGKMVGPWEYLGARTDDPNDIVPHENRRELRGLRVFSAWLNHTDAKSVNTLDSLVAENGVPYIKHYLLDFGSTLGSAGTFPNLPWYGYEYILETKDAAVQIATLGFYLPTWARMDYPKINSAGRFDYKSFDPVAWKPHYPNAAFLLMHDDDAFWAAKQVASFTDAEIRAIVETGEYSDPRATDWITTCLIKRRDKIAEAWLSQRMPLDRFSVADGKLNFAELSRGREYSIRWATSDEYGHTTPLPGATGRDIPVLQSEAKYLAATISCEGKDPACAHPLTVYLRRGLTEPEVVGLDR